MVRLKEKTVINNTVRRRERKKFYDLVSKLSVTDEEKRVIINQFQKTLETYINPR